MTKKKKEDTIEITKNDLEGEALETILRDPLTEQELIEVIKGKKDLLKLLMTIQMFIDDNGEEDFIVYEEYKQIESTIEARGKFKFVKELKQRVIDNLSRKYLKKMLFYYVKMLDTESKSLINELIRGFSFIDSEDTKEESILDLKKQLNEDKEYSKKYILLVFRVRRTNLDSMKEQRLESTIDSISSGEDIEKLIIRPIQSKIYYSSIFSNYHTIISYKFFELTEMTSPEEWEKIYNSKEWQETIESLEKQAKEREEIEEQIQLFETEQFEEDIPFVIEEETSKEDIEEQQRRFQAMEKDFENNHELFTIEEMEEYQKRLQKKFDEIEAFILSYEDIFKLRYNDILKLLLKDNSKAYEILKEKEIEEAKQEIIESEEELKKLEEDIFTKYEPIAKSKEMKNKLISTEKVVPQLFLQGNKITEQFEKLKRGEIEKVTFDLTGDSEDKFLVRVIMEHYPIEFTTGSLQTLESLMTTQLFFENTQHKVANIPFSTNDIIFLNKGGNVSKYTDKDKKETNKEIVALMSAIGSFDILEYMKEYNSRRPPEKQISQEKIKRISALQNFVYLKGIDIEYKDNQIPKNTIWYFVTEEPIPIFSFLRLVNRISMLPLRMDSYLQDNQINNEITRIIKGIVVNLRNYKNKDEKERKPRPYLFHYFKGTRIKDDEGNEIKNPKTDIFKPSEAYNLTKQKKLVGQWKYIAIRNIDSLAYEMEFDNERPINTEKQWKNKMEKPRFIDSIVEYLRKAKEDKIIEDFQLYTEKEKIIKDEDYITEGQQRKQKQKAKMKGIEKKPKKQKKNPPIYKIGIIMDQNQEVK